MRYYKINKTDWDYIVSLLNKEPFDAIYDPLCKEIIKKYKYKAIKK